MISKTGRYRIFSIGSAVINMTALSAYAFVSVDTSLYLVAALMLVNGLGIGMGQQVPVLGVQNAARVDDVGAATGTVTLTRMGGAAIGISIYGAVMSAGIGQFATPIPGVQEIKQLTPAIVANLSAETRQMIANAYAQACQPLFLTAAFFSLLCLVAAFSLKNIQLPTYRARSGG
jgi:hypothetical protein